MIKAKKSFIKILLLFILVFSLNLATPKPVYADATTVVQTIQDAAKWIWEKVSGVIKEFDKNARNRLIENVFRQFANKLAYDMANSIAEGAEGKKAYFRVDSIKKSLQNARNAALGEFIGDLTSKSFSKLGFNLCDPSTPEIKLTMTLSLLDSEAPPEPKCNWNDVQKQWGEFSDQITSGRWQDFIKIKLDPRYGTAKDWNDFWSQFDEGKNDLSVLETIRKIAAEKKAEVDKIKAIEASECQGFSDNKTVISEEVKTHCMQIKSIADANIQFVTEADIAAKKKAETKKVAWGEILADAGSMFMRTLSSRLMKFYIEKGMRQIASWYKEDPDLRASIIDKLRAGADLRRAPRDSDVFRDLKTTSFETVENFSLVENFIICPDQVDFRHPDNCAMTPELLSVLSQKKTIKQAISDGDLDGALPFISASDPRNNSDSCYKEGFCYHNLVKLRKANIVPIGWELAAQASSGGQAATLQQIIDCFEDATCTFGTNANNPYYHLVDPNWVLKVPTARCEAFVYTPTLEANGSSNRQQYCADVKTCLKEDDEGNCLNDAYGYCTQSANVWRLNADRCEDGNIYAGCLILNNEDLGEKSYLEQSLEYCGADSTGCKRYSQEKEADNDWVLQDIEDDDNDLFLNKQASACNEEDGGCSEFIVMSANRSVNILPNGDFDYQLQNWGTSQASGAIIVEDAYFGQNALSFSQIATSSAETGYPLKDRTFILSFYAKADNAGTQIEAKILTAGDNSENVTDDLTPNWKKIEAKHTFINTVNASEISLNIHTAGEVIIDAVKLEEVSNTQSNAGSFSSYGDGTRIFMTDARQMCVPQEVGCQGYYPNNNDPMIPAVVNSGDLCPNECVGYENFAQAPTYFDNSEALAASTEAPTEYYNFIPSTAQSCPSIAIGCEEFTNEEALAAGGEAKEYFTYLRQCVASSEANTATFYTWEGEDVAGYQLKTWTFLENSDGEPCTNINPGENTCRDNANNKAICGSETPNNPYDDPEYNPNCREFFDTDSNSHFRLQDKVIYASDECKTYRRAISGEKYQAIANLSHSCSAQYNGCRAYTGNAGNNIRKIFLDNFEGGSYNPWGDSGLDLSNQALANNGHSLKISANSSINRPIANLRDRQAYQLTWWMKNTGNLSSVQAQLYDGISEFSHPIESLGVVATGDWRRYQLTVQTPIDLASLDDISLRLTFSGVGEVFLDNILFNEVADNLSFVKNSWNTPAACDDPFTGAYLGCQAYTDTNGSSYTFKSFANLCREEAIGCLAAIDTKNSKSPFSESFHISDNSQIEVSADSVTYLVPEQDKYCPQAYKGCSELGLPILDKAAGTIIGYQTVYKINNPENYNQSLCNNDELYCEEYNSDKGTYYFKDPGNRTCTYKKNVNVSGVITTGWFKTDTLETTSPVACGQAELTEPNNWAQACPKDKNLCTEIKDPLDPIDCDISATAGSVNACQSYYYYKNDKIDQSSCNGQFDQNSGCTLLYDANNWNAAHTQANLIYNASSTYDKNIRDGIAVNPISDADNDSNMLVKVRKDRECSEWLDCKSSSAVFDDKTSTYKTICEAIDTCLEYDNINSINHCKRWAEATTTDDIALTTDVYRARVTGENNHLAWSDPDYLGYSIPNLLPLDSLNTYNFAPDSASQRQADIRLVYQADTNVCNGQPDYGTCSDKINNIDFDGKCKDDICWLNPYTASSTVPMSLALDTRAYTAADAPFAKNIREAQDQSNYSGANFCEDAQNACEMSYAKVSYGVGGVVKYLSTATSTEPSTRKVCTVVGEGQDELETDKKVGDFCDNDGECSNGQSGNIGKCKKPSKVETYMNWPGICLESDPSTSFPIDGNSNNEIVQKTYCNQWYPVDEVAGAQSLYNNVKEAGFYNDNGNLQMCMVPSDYVTTEDRYYCGATEGGFNNDEGATCTVLFYVPAGAKININAGEDLINFATGENYLLNSNNYIQNISGMIALVKTSQSVCTDDAQHDSDFSNECVNDGAFFVAEDFGKSEFNSIVINEEDITSLFDADISKFYFDEGVNTATGVFSLGDGTSNDNNKVLSVNYIRHGEGHSCAEDANADLCITTDHHQVESTFRRLDSNCGWGGENKMAFWRFCNVGVDNYYITINAATAQNICEETDCSEPMKGRACLRTYPGYSSIATPATCPAGDWACLYKKCVESLALTPAEPNYCSEYGFISLDIDGHPVSISQCLSYLFEISGNSVRPRLNGGNWTAWNNSLLNSAFYNCLVSTVGVDCHDEVLDNRSLTGDICSGFTGGTACLQQCQIISEIAADGNHDKSWVRTDIWWRYKNSNYSNSAWTAWYDSTASPTEYQNSVVATSTVNLYFGSARDSALEKPIITKTPVDTYQDPNKASIFFGNDIASAQAQMKWLFARLYNLTWANNSYGNGSSVDIEDANITENTVAGPDYDPIIYKVCAGDLCSDSPTGITINNQNTGDMSGHGSLFTAVQFYYLAHPDHMPVIDLTVDWEDNNADSNNAGKMKNNLPADYCAPEKYRPGSNTDKMSFGGLARACHSGYKTFYHTYTYNADTAYACDGAGGKPDIDNASCYQPIVTVKDNWEKTTSATYDGWIVVYSN